MTDERVEAGDDQSEIQGPDEEAAPTLRKATPRGAGPRSEGARVLRRALQREPPGVGWRPVELRVPHGRPGHRRDGAGEGVPVRFARGAVSLASGPGAPPSVHDAREVRDMRAV